MLRTMQLISLTTSNLDFKINKNFPVEQKCSTGSYSKFQLYTIYVERSNKQKQKKKGE
jgi:hypothetical protein